MVKPLTGREFLAWTVIGLQMIYIIQFMDLKSIPSYHNIPQVHRMMVDSSSAIATNFTSPQETTRYVPRNGQIATRLHDRVTGEEFLKIFHSESKRDNPLHGGTCWCSNPMKNDFCKCTPSLAIDVIVASGPDHVWLVRRADAGQYATVGGFVEVGETSAQAVAREVAEETSFTIQSPPRLFGIYDDPARDSKRYRHSVSVVYVVDIPLDAQPPSAGDDAKDVIRVSLDDLDDIDDFFIDHGTLLLDYRRTIRESIPAVDDTNFDWKSPYQRVVCNTNQ